MVVGVCRIDLRLPENASLKGKRNVLKSIMGRVRSRFDVAIAEVEGHDLWQLGSLGVSCVSTDAQHASEILSKVVAFVEHTNHEAEVIGIETEVLHLL